MFRVGIGYDIHRLVPKRKLFLGGVEIPFKKGLIGHSDADVLLHAVCDALLGAAGEGDIGHHFPNTRPEYKDISSLKLLKKVQVVLKRKKFKVVNVDTVVLAEEPKISSFEEKMKGNIARVLGIGEDRIAVKATTQEGLGDIGRSRAIAAYAVVSIQARRS